MTLSFSLCNGRPSRPFKCHSQGCCKVIVRSTFDVDIRLQTRLRLQMTMRTSGDTPISGGIFESLTFGQTPKVFVQNAWRPTRPTTKWCSAVSLPGSLSRPPETAKIHKVISFDSFFTIQHLGKAKTTGSLGEGPSSQKSFWIISALFLGADPLDKGCLYLFSKGIHQEIWDANRNQ